MKLRERLGVFVLTRQEQRTIAFVVLAALVPVALTLPALSALVAVTAVTWALVLWEALRYPDTRARIRHPSASTTG